eukprot:12129691-Heterocapsa_arctica.AAC.1
MIGCLAARLRCSRPVAQLLLGLRWGLNRLHARHAAPCPASAGPLWGQTARTPANDPQYRKQQIKT